MQARIEHVEIFGIGMPLVGTRAAVFILGVSENQLSVRLMRAMIGEGSTTPASYGWVGLL